MSNDFIFDNIDHVVPDPEVHILPVQEVYMIGDTVEMICTVAVSNINIGSNVNIHIQWINTASVVIKETTLSTSINNTYETDSLTIENVNISDAGQYACRASTTSNTLLLVHGDVVHDNIDVNVMCKL